MRQRKVRNLDEKLELVEACYLHATYEEADADPAKAAPRHDRWGQEAPHPCDQRGHWRELFAGGLRQNSGADTNAEGEAQHVSSEAQAAPLERNVASAASTVSGSGVPDSLAAGAGLAPVTDRALYAELGCGKGRFIAEMAQRHPEDLFLGIEGHQGVLLRAGQKLMEQQTGNARLLCAYVHDIRDFFAEGELDGLYLNFSDPWPKARHEKRRLTHRAYLASYRDVVKKGGFLAFKTDNDGLFEFTLEEIAAEGYDILEMSRDLHNSAYAADNVMTEYEARFSENGKTINYVKIAL